MVFCWYFKKIYFAKTLFLRIVCRTRARGTYGPTVKNLTLTFWPRTFSWPVHMYRKSPRKFERKFQCKIFHGRPLFVEVPKIRTSPNASFLLIWPNWDMKEMEMWPKAIMVWKYDGSRPTLQTISEVSSPGPEIWFFYKKKISDLLLTRQSNICRKKQIFVFNIMLIVWASLFFNHLCGGQRVSFGGNSVSRHNEKVENTHMLGPAVKFFLLQMQGKTLFHPKFQPCLSRPLIWVGLPTLVCVFSVFCQFKLLLSTFLKPILILSLGDLFLYGTETMICHLKRQGWKSGFGTVRGVRR